MPGYRVLVIEDDPDLCKLVKHALDRQYNSDQGASFECVFTPRLSGAGQIARQNAVNLALLDLRLPNGEGFESITKFQAECPDIPLVVWTGYYTPENARRAMIDFGVQDFFAKPLDIKQIPERLIGAIARWEHVKAAKVETDALRGKLSAANTDLANAQTIAVTRITSLSTQIDDQAREIIELRKQDVPKTWLNEHRTTLITSSLTAIVAVVVAMMAKC